MAALNVLVVEDDVDLITMYERVLRRLDCDVVAVRDGQQAIEYLSANTPDLVFLDMYLPRVSGQAVVEYMAGRPAFERTELIVASSSREYECAFQGLRQVRFILKPILPTQMRAIALPLLRTQAR